MEPGRGVEIALAAALVLLPSRLHWSRDSAGVLRAAGAILVGAGAVSSTTNRAPSSGLNWLARNRQVIVGAALFCVQYLLTEEEGSVRGLIATVGGGLIAAGLWSHRFGNKSSWTCQ